MTDFEKLVLRALEQILHNQVAINSIETHRVAIAIKTELDKAAREVVEALK